MGWFQRPPKGCYATVLQPIQRLDEHVWECFDTLVGDKIMVLSQIPMEGTVTCYGVTVIDNDPTTVEVDHTKMFEASQVDTSFFGREIVELCAGAGAMGHAIEQLGGKVAVAIDQNSLAYEHLRANHADGVIQGDIRKTEVIEKAHRFLSENGIERFSVTAGFPCQPFSTQGLQLGNQDGRFDTFRGLLVAVMLLAPQAVLLECVPGASRDPEVQAGLDWLMQKLGWEKREYGTDLSWFWPMRRNRWFCVLAPPAWIQNMCYKIEGSITELRVGDVLSEFVHDHEVDLSQLQLSEYELACYNDKRLGSDKRQLEASDICATALHSYASPLCKCPCGCRSHSFAEASLVLHGLRGFYVIAGKHDKPRYLTTQEMATLLTVGDTMHFSTNEKANLCLLGQIAAPAQVIRVYGELMHSAAVNLNKVNAELLLQQYLKKIQIQQGKPRNPHTVEMVPTVILEPNEPAITFAAHIGTQTQQILKAERINKTWGTATTLQSNEQTLPDDFSIHALNEPPQIQRATKKSRSTLELLRIVVLLKHKGNATPVIGHAGDFLFQFLPDPSITQDSWILTKNGETESSPTRGYGTPTYSPSLMTKTSPDSFKPKISEAMAQQQWLDKHCPPWMRKDSPTWIYTSKSSPLSTHPKFRLTFGCQKLTTTSLTPELPMPSNTFKRFGHKATMSLVSSGNHTIGSHLKHAKQKATCTFPFGMAWIGTSRLRWTSLHTDWWLPQVPQAYISHSSTRSSRHIQGTVAQLHYYTSNTCLASMTTSQKKTPPDGMKNSRPISQQASHRVSTLRTSQTPFHTASRAVGQTTRANLHNYFTKKESLSLWLIKQQNKPSARSDTPKSPESWMTKTHGLHSKPQPIDPVSTWGWSMTARKQHTLNKEPVQNMGRKSRTPKRRNNQSTNKGKRSPWTRNAWQ